MHDRGIPSQRPRPVSSCRPDAATGRRHHNPPTPSYGIADLSAGPRRGTLSVTAGVANLFNQYFVEHLSYQRDPFRSGIHVADPGRNGFSSVTWKL
jgi:outer membrane receptor protein involved in Fe transport